MEAKKSLIATHFYHQDIEDAITSFESEKDDFKMKGQYDGQSSQILTEDSWKARVFNPLQAHVQCIVDMVQQKVQPVAGAVVQNDEAILSQSRIQRIQPEMQNAALAAGRYEREMDMNRPDRTKRLWRLIVHCSIVLFACVDWYVGFDAYRSDGLKTIPAALNGLGIAITLSIGSIFLSEYAMRAPTKSLRRLRIIVGCVIAALVFCYLGNARAALYNQVPVNLHAATSDVTQPDTIDISGFVLAGTSFFFFIVSVFFSCMVFKTKEEQERDEKYKHNWRKRKEALQSLNEKSEKIETIEDNSLNETTTAKMAFEYAEASKKKALAIAECHLGGYAEQYIQFMDNKPCPSFLSNPPAFTIRSFFHQIHKN